MKNCARKSFRRSWLQNGKRRGCLLSGVIGIVRTGGSGSWTVWTDPLSRQVKFPSRKKYGHLILSTRSHTLPPGRFSTSLSYVATTYSNVFSGQTSHKQEILVCIYSSGNALLPALIWKQPPPLEYIIKWIISIHIEVKWVPQIKRHIFVMVILQKLVLHHGPASKKHPRTPIETP